MLPSCISEIYKANINSKYLSKSNSVLINLITIPLMNKIMKIIKICLTVNMEILSILKNYLVLSELNLIHLIISTFAIFESFDNFIFCLMS